MQNELTDHIIKETLDPYGISPSAELCEKIRIYIATLLQWNARIALTTVTDIEEILRVHFGESFFAAGVAGIKEGRAADIGTGAGFPGIPIRMVKSNLSLTLIEPVTKKTVFLAEVLRKIDISDVQVMRCRMEEVAEDVVGFDFILARALGRYAELLAWAKPRVPAGGKAVLLVGEQDATQIGKIPSWEWSEAIRIPGSESKVVLVGSAPRI